MGMLALENEFVLFFFGLLLLLLPALVLALGLADAAASSAGDG